MTICSQVEFKAAVFPDKEDDFVMIKGPTHQEDKIILNVHIADIFQNMYTLTKLKRTEKFTNILKYIY